MTGENVELLRFEFAPKHDSGESPGTAQATLVPMQGGEHVWVLEAWRADAGGPWVNRRELAELYGEDEVLRADKEAMATYKKTLED